MPSWPASTRLVAGSNGDNGSDGSCRRERGGVMSGEEATGEDDNDAAAAAAARANMEPRMELR